jgi:predicted nucleic acid-binding protein
VPSPYVNPYAPEVQRLILRINDSWIAATAIANGMPVASQDGDYDDVPGLEVIRV